MTNTNEQSIQTLEIIKDQQIAAPAEVVFETILEQLGPASAMPDGTPFPMKLEAHPGGRWYRDLGKDTGHFWAHVQVIKPPTLLELCGPLFMSYPATNFLQYRLKADGDGTRLTLTHKAMGLIPAEHQKNVHEGWDDEMKKIREAAERKAGARR